MKESLLTSLKLSKRLEKLGVKQESEFYWQKSWASGKYYLVTQGNVDTSPDAISYSVFLSGELGEMLPVGWFSIEKGDDRWYVNPSQVPEEFFLNNFHYQAHKNLAEAMGEMLAYLVENKLIKI